MDCAIELLLSLIFLTQVLANEELDIIDLVEYEPSTAIPCYQGTSKWDRKPKDECRTGDACFKFEFKQVREDSSDEDESNIFYEWGCTDKDMCENIVMSLDTCVPDTVLITGNENVKRKGTHCCCSTPMCNSYESTKFGNNTQSTYHHSLTLICLLTFLVLFIIS